MAEVKIDMVFDNLQEILDRINQETENITEDPYCLAFYDSTGKLWQLKECPEDKDNKKYIVDTSSIAFDQHHVLEAGLTRSANKTKRKDSRDEILELMETKIRNEKEYTIKELQNIKMLESLDDYSDDASIDLDNKL